MKQTEVLTHVNGCVPAVYMINMRQKLPFKFIRSKLSKFYAHVSGVSPVCVLFGVDQRTGYIRLMVWDWYLADFFVSFLSHSARSIALSSLEWAETSSSELR